MSFPFIITALSIAGILAICVGLTLLRRALSQPRVLPEEVALAAAWVFIVGGLFWLGVYLTDSTFLGYGVPWTWLTAAHFTFAGFGALTLTSLACRVVGDRRALHLLRMLLVLHPIAYLFTAAGILGFRFFDEIGAVAYGILFVCQFAAVLCGRPYRMPSFPSCLLLIAFLVPVITMIPAVAWAFERPLLSLPGMIQYHGIVNAIGFVGLGLIACALGRPPSQVDNRELIHREAHEDF